jgi:hypothetical protein
MARKGEARRPRVAPFQLISPIESVYMLGHSVQLPAASLGYLSRGYGWHHI